MDRDNTENWFQVALTLAKCISELHSLSFEAKHMEHQNGCIFSLMPDYVAKTLNPSVQGSLFGEYLILPIRDSCGQR